MRTVHEEYVWQQVGPLQSPPPHCFQSWLHSGRSGAGGFVGAGAGSSVGAGVDAGMGSSVGPGMGSSVGAGVGSLVAGRHCCTTGNDRERGG